jgi:hypothetical protein
VVKWIGMENNLSQEDLGINCKVMVILDQKIGRIITAGDKWRNSKEQL